MGLRALAVDGTDLRLESRAYEEMLDVYSKNGEHLPLSVRDPQSPNIRASALYDIENNIVVDLQFGPKIFSEEELLLRHTEVMNIDDLIVTDRGYHSIWF